MPIDTAVKRGSLLGVASPSVLIPIPEGSIGAFGRATLSQLYSGVFDSVTLVLDGVEILFPIKYLFKTDKLVTENDKGEFKTTQINSTSVRNEIVELSLKIRASKLSSFFNTVRSQYGKSVILSKTGIQLFNNSNTTNDVLIVGYSAPTKINSRQYSMSLKVMKE